MSLITDAIVLVHYATDDLRKALVQPFPFDTQREQSFGHLDKTAMSQAGGSKFFCSDLYAGAFNFVSVYDLADWFLALPWSEVDTATLSAEGENDDYICISVFRGQHIKVESECVDGWADKYRLVVAANEDDEQSLPAAPNSV